jgi:hypothetical protein
VATTDSLKTFADKGRATNATAHPCKLTATRKATVDGAPAIIDENTCEVFAMSATIVRDGHAYVFFTYGAASDESGIRTGFESLLKVVAFD